MCPNWASIALGKLAHQTSLLLPEIKELLKLDFYLSLFLVLTYKINTLAQVGAQVSHQEPVALLIPLFCFMSVGVLFLIPHCS
jgi:hypothetical protein